MCVCMGVWVNVFVHRSLRMRNVCVVGFFSMTYTMRRLWRVS